jgi:hypothetical protein
MFNFNPYNPLSMIGVQIERDKRDAHFVASSPTRNVQKARWTKKNIHCFPNPDCGSRGRKDRTDGTL